MRKDIGIAVPRKMEVRIKKGKSQIFLKEKDIVVSGATSSKEWLESISDSLEFVSVLLNVPLAGLTFVLKMLPYRGRLRKPKRRVKLEGKSASFPFAMLLLSIFLNVKLPKGVFFSGCLSDAEGWLARTEFRIVESKARCLSDMNACLDADNVAFYVPKWILNNLGKPLHTELAGVEIWGVQNILECLKSLNPRVYERLHSSYVRKFLDASNLDLGDEAIREVRLLTKKQVGMLLVDAKQRALNKELTPEDIKHTYEQGGLTISKVIDLRSRTDTSPVLVYLVADDQIRWKEVFVG